jgi:hypothetical protein
VRLLELVGAAWTRPAPTNMLTSKVWQKLVRSLSLPRVVTKIMYETPARTESMFLSVAVVP